MIFRLSKKAMVLEHQKYKAEIFKIAGFALLTPISVLVWDFLKNGLVINIQFLISLIGSIFLAFLGTIILQRGYEELME